MISSFFMSFAVAFLFSAVAGALWSRLIGWMGKEPLAYMLTLGFVFLLYFAVEELHGSAALAVLMFGMMLENMHVIAGRVGNQARYLFGIDIRAEQERRSTFRGRGCCTTFRGPSLPSPCCLPLLSRDSASEASSARRFSAAPDYAA